MSKAVFALVVGCMILAAARNADAAPLQRILVVPFANESEYRGDDPKMLGYAALIIEALVAGSYADGSYEVVVGPLTLTQELAKLVSLAGQQRSLEPIAVLAKKERATHVITGAINGPVWMREFRCDVYVVGPQGLALAGTHSVSRNLFAMKQLAGGGQKAVPSMTIATEVLAKAVTSAAKKAKLELNPVVLKVLQTPAVDDDFAFLVWSRAFAAKFGVRSLPRAEQSAKQAIRKKIVRAKRPRNRLTKRQRRRIAAGAMAGQMAPADEALAVAQRAAVDIAGPKKFVLAQRLYALLLLERAELAMAAAKRSNDPLQKKAAKQALYATQVALEFAVGVDAHDVPSLVVLASVELKLDNPAEAVRRFVAAAEISVRDARILTELARAYLAVGKSAEAVVTLERARTIAPGFLDGRRLLALKYAEAKRYREAAGEYRALRAAVPADDAVANDLGAALLAAGEAKAAAEVWRGAAEAFVAKPKLASRFRKFSGDALLRAGDEAAARSAYRAAYDANHRDVRMAAMFTGRQTAVLVGSELIAHIAALSELRAAFDEQRNIALGASNDLIAGFGGDDYADCENGKAARVFRLAARGFQQARAIAGKLEAARRKGGAATAAEEHLALTPDVRLALETIVRRTAKEVPAGLHLAERMVNVNAINALNERGCSASPLSGPAMTPEELRDRNAKRSAPAVSDAKKAEWRRAQTRAGVISPRVSLPDGIKVLFMVDNRGRTSAAVLYVNNKKIGEVKPNSQQAFPVDVGEGMVCTEAPESRVCKSSTHHRRLLFHDRMPAFRVPPTR